MTLTNHASSPAVNNLFLQSNKPKLTRLAELIQNHAPYDGAHALRLAGLYAVRASRTNTDLYHALYKPSLCIVAQGSKSLFLGSDVYQYDASCILVCSVELPVASLVTQASPTKPFLSLKLDFEPQRIAELALKVYPHGLPPVRENRGVYVSQTNLEIVSAATRLMELMTDDSDVGLIAPLVVEELLIRLLRSPVGNRVAQIGQTESNVHRIAKAVDWVRKHYDQPMNVEELAAMIHMSASAFHQHFKAVTNMSPLQFQKTLRLREARRLMLTSMMDAATAGRQVGYVSASQFSREYGRLFGNAPSRDIARLREQGYMQPSVV
jgi:AraC-like DNA-binding protein